MSAPERRSAQRFDTRLPLLVRWTTGSAIGEAITESEDVSSKGIYFSLPKNVKVGSPIEIVMTLPPELTLVGPIRVRCLGRILRTNVLPNRKVGAGVAIERYEFLRGDEDTA